jgi:hypothetical protein
VINSAPNSSKRNYLADEDSVLVPADVAAAIVDSSKKETLRVTKVWQLARQADRAGNVETCGDLDVQALMRALVVKYAAKVIEAALLCAKGCSGAGGEMQTLLLILKQAGGWHSGM